MAPASVQFGRLRRQLAPHGKRLAAGAVALMVLNSIGAVLPLLVQDTIDRLAPGFTMGSLAGGAAMLLGLATIMAAVRMASRLLVFGVGISVEMDLRQQLFDHLLGQEPDWLARMRTGELITRATYDVNNIRRMLGFAVLNMVNVVMIYGLQIPAMVSIDLGLSVAALVLHPAMLLLVHLFGKRMARLQRRQQEHLSELSDLIQEDLAGISAIKIYGQQANEHEAFSVLNRNYRNAALSLAKVRSLLFPALEKISNLSLLLLLVLGAGRLEAATLGDPQGLTIGGFVALLLYAERLVFPTALFGFTINTFQVGQVSLERVEEVLMRQPRITDPATAEPLTPQPAGQLRVRNLHYRYPDSKREALAGVSFTLEPGEMVALVGAVGCGKSTIARLLGRMIDPPEQSVFLDGQDIRQLRLDDLRGRIALVPQEAYLFTATMEDNLRYGQPDTERQRVVHYAASAQLSQDIDAFPAGLDTMVGERGITLSGGQRQRSALARALLQQAPLLVLDDALASVDNATASGILENLRQHRRSTVLFISHQLAAAASCDRVLVMEAGRIVQSGQHQTLLHQSGPYQQLWRRQELETSWSLE